MNRTDRLVGILLELQARGELRGEDLARRFEVSLRTVYRDMEALSESGVPVVATPGKGYRLMDGYFMPPVSFTATEAAVLALGGRYVQGRVDAELRRAADDALAKLIGVLPRDKRDAVDRWQQEFLFPQFAPGSDDEKLARLRAAIRGNRVVRLVYHGRRRGVPVAREVEPFSLVHLADSWHVGTYCRLRRDTRLFRLDRIDRLEVLRETFTPSAWHRRPADDDERGAFPEVRVRFDAAVERWVRERQPYTFLREEADAVFVYALRDRRELVQWVLGWGAAAEVLEPADLRAEVAAEATAVAARHFGPPSPDLAVPAPSSGESTAPTPLAGRAGVPPAQSSVAGSDPASRRATGTGGTPALPA